MPRRENKEKILEATIKLLDAHAYNDVSMREIASEAGIRASSIYNHFAGKGEMLDAVVDAFRDELRKKGIHNEVTRVLSREELLQPQKVLTELMIRPLVLLDDPSFKRIINVVRKCQYYHAGIRHFLNEEMFERPLKLIKNVLEQLKMNGLLAELPLDFLAAELQGVMVANFYQISLQDGNEEQDLERICRAMKEHVAFFWLAASRRSNDEKRN